MPGRTQADPHGQDATCVYVKQGGVLFAAPWEAALAEGLASLAVACCKAPGPGTEIIGSRRCPVRSTCSEGWAIGSAVFAGSAVSQS